MILHFYFARRFATGFAMITAVLFALVMLIDGVEQARKFGSFDIGWQKIIGLTLLNTPQTINLILPLIVILATVALFISLARSSELVVTRAAGRSARFVCAGCRGLCDRSDCRRDVEPYRCGHQQTVFTTV